MSDINKVWLSGVAITRPVMTSFASHTPSTSFTLQISEKFQNRAGEAQVKQNLITIESLGKHAEQIMHKIKQGGRYMVDGYLRQDLFNGENKVRVRSFAVYPDETAENLTHKEGLRQAIEIMKKSRDLDSAIQKLEEVLGG